MPFLRRAFQATANGLLVALLAPPMAAVVFLLISVALPATGGERFDSSVSSILLLMLGVTAGSYLVGVIPAFLAGLALPGLRRVLSPVLASAATGCVGTLAYSLTFGSHLMLGHGLLNYLHVYALPAFAGVTVAALLALLIERRHTEA